MKGETGQIVEPQSAQLQQSKENLQEPKSSSSDKEPLIKIIIIWLAIGFFFCVFLAIIALYYYLCHFFLPPYVSTIILIVIILFLLRKAVYYLLFPGQFYYHRSSLEEKFCNARIRPIIYRLDIIVDFLKCLKREESLQKLMTMNAVELKQAKLHVDQANQALAVLQGKQKLTNLQIEIMRVFDLFLKGLENTCVVNDTFTFSIMNLISNQKDIDTIIQSCNLEKPFTKNTYRFI